MQVVRCAISKWRIDGKNSNIKLNNPIALTMFISWLNKIKKSTLPNPQNVCQLRWADWTLEDTVHSNDGRTSVWHFSTHHGRILMDTCILDWFLRIVILLLILSCIQNCSRRLTLFISRPKDFTVPSDRYALDGFNSRNDETPVIISGK